MTDEQKKVTHPTPIEQMRAAGYDLWCIGKLLCAMEGLTVNEEAVAWLGIQVLRAEREMSNAMDRLQKTHPVLAD